MQAFLARVIPGLAHPRLHALAKVFCEGQHLEWGKGDAAEALGFVKICASHGPVMGLRVVLGEVVGQVFVTTVPKNAKVVLLDPVLDPVKPHVHGFGPFLFKGVVRDSRSGGVIHLDGCGWLWVAHFEERHAKAAGFLCIMMQGAQFGFGC
jgi:hypothetical protein